MTFPDQPAADPLHALRTRVLRFALNVLALAMPVISGMMVATAVQRDTLTLRTVVLSGSVLFFPLLWLVRDRLGYRRTVGVLIALLAFSASLLASRGILTVGYAALTTLTVLSASLFFGRRGAVAGIAVVLVVHFAAFGLIQAGFLPPLEPEMWDPRIPAIWVRQGIILALLGTVIAAMELYVVEQLAHQVDVHRELAAREMRQRVALEQAERDREHERVQREQAQHALEQARRLEALARMSGGIAHDFNNALTVIMGTADVARLGVAPTTDTAQCLDEIIQASKRAAELTTQLMTLGRQHVASKRPVDMGEFLGQLRVSLRRVLPDDVTLVVDVPATPLVALADAAGLERALYNLVLNARDAMPRGGGAIAVTCAAETVAGGLRTIADGSYVALRVADTGHGMNPETLERIFDPFFTTKMERGGTGLGLATVYAFAAEAGGEIEATSQPGVGTTFTLRLPLYTGADAPVAVDAAVAELPAPRRHGRVLVVEDRQDVRANIVRTLQLHGFSVSEASDGDTAVDVLTTAPDFDLMCIDGVMPGMATAEVIERARRLSPALRVLVCSGHVREDLLRRGVETGRYAFLAKPFTSEQLLDGVDAALRAPAPSVTPLQG